MEMKLIGLVKNDEIESGLNGGYGYAPVFSINKKATEKELKDYVKANHKEIINLCLNSLKIAEMESDDFADYINDIWGLDIEDESAKDDYSKFLYDYLIETFSDNPNIIIKTSTSEYMEFIVY